MISINVSGDGDYLPLVEYLQKAHGRQVEIAAFGETSSRRLVDHADDFLDLSEDKTKFLIGDGRKKTYRSVSK